MGVVDRLWGGLLRISHHDRQVTLMDEVWREMRVAHRFLTSWYTGKNHFILGRVNGTSLHG